MLPRRSVLCLSLLPVKLKSHRLRCSVLLESCTLTESVYPLPLHCMCLFYFTACSAVMLWVASLMKTSCHQDSADEH